MTTLRQCTCNDLFRINLDPNADMYSISFYLEKLARWPEYFMVAESPSGDLVGCIIGKTEVRTLLVLQLARLKPLSVRAVMTTGIVA